MARIHRGARRCCGVDIGSADHLTNCLCVARIVLLALDVLSRRHQTYSMAEKLLLLLCIFGSWASKTVCMQWIVIGDARACRGHPRLCAPTKAWMAGPRPAMSAHG